ncbi:M48 family metalloprotease (plasmid) [Photobacterium sp. DA100]|uniref:M48 family metallopeptidase n=1 Tax=Photobacterium sp. DA100 TaxID=3027472 RepID=UPI00247B0DDD|nr:M48 family metallopeptidase [Photobacterium sp. DA100]WEM44668.1 M48 family metalloprotease [Photobacterium sp. DA100]
MMRQYIALLVMSGMLSGCAMDSLKTLTGSTYEGVDGKYIHSLTPETNQTHAKQTVTSEKSEVAEEDRVFYRAAADKNLIANPYAEKYLNGILAKLLDTWGQPVDRDIKVVISADRNYSALATMDTIVVTQGVLGDADSEDELAFIIAHELSHILLDHNDTNEYFAKQSALVSKAANIAMVSAVVSDLETQKTANGIKLSSKNSASANKALTDSYRIGVTINRLSRDVLSSSMSRQDEDEADLLGVDLIVKAGYSARAYYDVMDRLESSQVFNKAQLAAKKQDFQSFVSMASKAEKHVNGSNLETLGYLAANEAATRLLQDFADRHNSPSERKQDLNHYVKREYRIERRRDFSTEKMNKALHSGKAKQIQKNYWAASEAMRAVEFGDLDKAEKLARQAVSGPTSSHAYPRLAYYTVRKLQNKPDKAAQNLALIKNWDYASIQTFALASQAFRSQKQHQKAEQVLNKAKATIGSDKPFLPEYVALYRSMGEQAKLDEHLKRCHNVKEQNIVVQCQQAAGVAIPEDTKKASKGLFDSITSFVEI